MEWYIWLGIIAGGILVYFGLGGLVAGLISVVEKKTADRKEKPYKGLSRAQAWVTVLGWPLIVAVLAIFVALALAVVGFVIALAASLIALILAVVGILIALVLSIVAAVIALAIGFIVACILTAIILSPIGGLETLRGVVTRFNPFPYKREKKKIK